MLSRVFCHPLVTLSGCHTEQVGCVTPTDHLFSHGQQPGAWKSGLALITSDVFFHKLIGFLPELKRSFSIHRNQWQRVTEVKVVREKIAVVVFCFVFFFQQTACWFYVPAFNAKDTVSSWTIFFPLSIICNFIELFHASSSCCLVYKVQK